MLMGHYASTLDFSNDALQAAEKGLQKLLNAEETLHELSPSSSSSYDVSSLKLRCYEAMNDDFNTPILLAHLFEAVKIINSVKAGTESLNHEDVTLMKEIFSSFVHNILGLENRSEKINNDLTDDVMNIILKLRTQAKTQKNTR